MLHVAQGGGHMHATMASPGSPSVVQALLLAAACYALPMHVQCNLVNKRNPPQRATAAAGWHGPCTAAGHPSTCRRSRRRCKLERALPAMLANSQPPAGPTSALRSGTPQQQQQQQQ